MKIMNIIKIFLALIVFAGAYTSCKKLPDGFISALVRYEEDPIIIQKGRVKVSSALNFDGSTYQLIFKSLATIKFINRNFFSILNHQVALIDYSIKACPVFY